jgi:16S rRNA (cytosine967-C5)-methyltransferase
MAVTAREVARRVLARVGEGAYATLTLGGELGRTRLSDADRALATELVYGVLKRRARLDWALGRLAPRGLQSIDARVLDTLRLGAYQILFLRIPAHAAVDDAVETVKRVRGPKLGGFVNALLRRLAREGEPPPPDPSDAVAHLAVVESAPAWLVKDALARFPAPEARAFLASLNVPAPVWLRVNTLRATRDEVAAALERERPSARVTPSERAPEALKVEGGGDVATTRPFTEGRATVQDLAAQAIARLVDPAPGEHVLDACAGVGGKSTHLAALMRNQGRIDSADLSERKLELASDAARRLGVECLHPRVADLTDPRAPLEPAYDRVLLDAPCSGLGVLRRHPEAKWRRQPEDARALAATQAKLLAALAPRVRPGGVLVYSVCTFTDEEGPRQTDAFLATHPQFTREGDPLHTWPHRDDADAFYAIRLRRKP